MSDSGTLGMMVIYPSELQFAFQMTQSHPSELQWDTKYDRESPQCVLVKHLGQH